MSTNFSDGRDKPEEEDQQSEDNILNCLFCSAKFTFDSLSEHLHSAHASLIQEAVHNAGLSAGVAVARLTLEVLEYNQLNDTGRSAGASHGASSNPPSALLSGASFEQAIGEELEPLASDINTDVSSVDSHHSAEHTADQLLKCLFCTTRLPPSQLTQHLRVAHRSVVREAQSRSSLPEVLALNKLTKEVLQFNRVEPASGPNNRRETASPVGLSDDSELSNATSEEMSEPTCQQPGVPFIGCTLLTPPTMNQSQEFTSGGACGFISRKRGPHFGELELDKPHKRNNGATLGSFSQHPRSSSTNGSYLINSNQRLCASYDSIGELGSFVQHPERSNGINNEPGGFNERRSQSRVTNCDFESFGQRPNWTRSSTEDRKGLSKRLDGSEIAINNLDRVNQNNRSCCPFKDELRGSSQLTRHSRSAASVVRGFSERPSDSHSNDVMRGFSQRPSDSHSNDVMRGFSQRPSDSQSNDVMRGFSQRPSDSHSNDVMRGFSQRPSDLHSNDVMRGFSQRFHEYRASDNEFNGLQASFDDLRSPKQRPRVSQASSDDFRGLRRHHRDSNSDVNELEVVDQSTLNFHAYHDEQRGFDRRHRNSHSSVSSLRGFSQRPHGSYFSVNDFGGFNRVPLDSHAVSNRLEGFQAHVYELRGANHSQRQETSEEFEGFQASAEDFDDSDVNQQEHQIFSHSSRNFLPLTDDFDDFNQRSRRFRAPTDQFSRYSHRYRGPHACTDDRFRNFNCNYNYNDYNDRHSLEPHTTTSEIRFASRDPHRIHDTTDDYRDSGRSHSTSHGRHTNRRPQTANEELRILDRPPRGSLSTVDELRFFSQRPGLSFVINNESRGVRHHRRFLNIDANQTYYVTTDELVIFSGRSREFESSEARSASSIERSGNASTGQVVSLADFDAARRVQEFLRSRLYEGSRPFVNSRSRRRKRPSDNRSTF